MATVQDIQRALLARDFDLGKGGADGDAGPITRAAILEAINRLPLPLPEKAPAPADKPADLSDPAWIATAKKYLGQKEIAGPQHNPHVLKWWKDMGTSFKDDETPWCGAFVGGVLAEVGIKPAKSGAMARAWNSFGKKLDKPAVGCIVVFWRGSKSGSAGHVGFVLGKDQHGNLMVLGGNQGNKVSIAPFDQARVLGFRWPGIAPYESRYKLPLIGSDGKLSTNEA
jgi:uncharacterized protein (TIGR02594 family)